MMNVWKLNTCLENAGAKCFGETHKSTEEPSIQGPNHPPTSALNKWHPRALKGQQKSKVWSITYDINMDWYCIRRIFRKNWVINYEYFFICHIYNILFISLKIKANTLHDYETHKKAPPRNIISIIGPRPFLKIPSFPLS